MLEVRKTVVFDEWLRKLRDVRAKDRIVARIRRIELTGNFGDVKNLKDGVSEFRIDHGAGYRLYFTGKGPTIVILLCGGDKRTQRADIAQAKDMARNMKE